MNLHIQSLLIKISIMKYFAFLLMCLCVVDCQQQERRRRIKKKIIVTSEPQQVEDVTDAETIEEDVTLKQDINSKPKEPRG